MLRSLPTLADETQCWIMSVLGLAGLAFVVFPDNVVAQIAGSVTGVAAAIQLHRVTRRMPVEQDDVDEEHTP